MKIEVMRSFHEVARRGNIADAADVLGRTQPAISMALKQFETEIGGVLFMGERKNALTELGKQIFELVSQELERFDETVNSMRVIAAAPQGIVRCAAIPSIAAIVYPPALSKFTHEFPQVHVELMDTDSHHVFSLLSRGLIDIGIASGLENINNAHATLLLSDPFVLVTAKDSAVDTSQPTQFLNNPLFKRTGDHRLATLGQGQLFVRNTHSLLALVRSGNFFTILPRTVISNEPALVGREMEDFAVTREVYLYRRKEGPNIHLAAQFSDLVIEALDQTVRCRASLLWIGCKTRLAT